MLGCAVAFGAATSFRFDPRSAAMLAATLTLSCGAAPQVAQAPEATRAPPGDLQVFAEGPCPKLSIEAAGERRFLVYGDHGRVLAGWLPGDRVATAETLAELRGGRAHRRPSLLRGLPTDARGYVEGELRLGGSAEDPWLLRTTVRYSLVKRGPLFEREPSGYRFRIRLAADPRSGERAGRVARVAGAAGAGDLRSGARLRAPDVGGDAQGRHDRGRTL